MTNISQQAQFSLINPRSFTPIRTILLMAALWAVILALAPIGIYRSDQLYPYLLLGISFVALLVGLALFEPRSIPTITMDPEERRRMLRSLYRIAFILGALGIAARLGDWILLRGLQIDTDFLENREKIETAGSNALSMASTLLVPFSLTPYIIYAVARRNGDKVGKAWQSLGLALLWPALTIIIGSRSMMMMSLGMLFIARMTIFPRTSKLIVWTCVIGGLVLVYLGGLIFLERLTQVGLKPEGVMKLSSFTKLAPVTNEYYRLTASASEVWRNTIFIFTTFSQYYVHGVPEFVYQVEHYNGADQWGAYTFNVFGRASAALWGVPYDSNAILNLPPRLGVYTTLFGPFYIDFGPLVPISGFLFGAAISWTRRCVLRGDIGALSLYIAFTMQIILCVAINGITAAYGIFYTSAFAAFWLGCVMVRRRSRRSPAATGPRPAYAALG
ncbi:MULTISPECIES: hypothetical protein [unclassified Inquilinus]|uniref:hypothetical protein n=1 Tax=unclassified Inquilinus TaxID=2645927 RepID=UPI003F90C120